MFIPTFLTCPVLVIFPVSVEDIEEFDDYVLEVERIITLRGLRIMSKLLDENFEVLVDKFKEEESRKDEVITDNENHSKNMSEKKS